MNDICGNILLFTSPEISFPFAPTINLLPSLVTFATILVGLIFIFSVEG